MFNYEQHIKIVFEDNAQTKVIKGYILEESEFVYSVKTDNGNMMVIGKRSIIQISQLNEDGK